MTEANTMLPFWQRLLATIVAMLVASFLAGLAWEAAFNFALPSYAAGMVGGLAALPVWDFLKRIRPSKP
jgi:Na+/glutamate symporter